METKVAFAFLVNIIEELIWQFCNKGGPRLVMCRKGKLKVNSNCYYSCHAKTWFQTDIFCPRICAANSCLMNFRSINKVGFVFLFPKLTNYTKIKMVIDHTSSWTEHVQFFSHSLNISLWRHTLEFSKLTSLFERWLEPFLSQWTA